LKLKDTISTVQMVIVTSSMFRSQTTSSMYNADK
jgi:hypothetical protein